MTQDSGSRIIVALDYDQEAKAMAFVDQVSPDACRLKVGKEMFTHLGPTFVEKLVDRGFDVFLDLKYHDIPNTVAKACEAAAKLNVWMMNVHVSGGRRMMEAAAEAMARQASSPLLIGVTILTSLTDDELAEVGYQGDAASNVQRMAALAKDSGLDGVVCSPKEITLLRESMGDDFNLVTPGIRPSFAEKGDQRRVMTPADAMAAGSSYLVIGRPITQADDPMQAMSLIQQEMNA